MGLDQIIIGLCGLSSVWLSQDSRPQVARFACLFGLAAQPAWFYTTYQAGQWAIFALAFVYTVGWGRGVWNFWLKPFIRARAERRAFAGPCDSPGTNLLRAQGVKFKGDRI